MYPVRAYSEPHRWQPALHVPCRASVTIPAVDDRGAIQNLMSDYTEFLDDARFDQLGRLFANGTVAIEGGPHSGRTASGNAEVSALYSGIVALDPDSGRTGTRHFITNYNIDIDGFTGLAKGRTYWSVTQHTPSLPLQIVACGAYHDEFERADGAWRYTRKHIVCDQVGDLSEHMR